MLFASFLVSDCSFTMSILDGGLTECSLHQTTGHIWRLRSDLARANGGLQLSSAACNLLLKSLIELAASFPRLLN